MHFRKHGYFSKQALEIHKRPCDFATMPDALRPDIAAAADRILFALKTHGPSTIGDLGKRFSMTAEAARQHLVKLQDLGLVTHTDERQAKGRPLRRWSLTEDGHARFPDRHADLSVDLIKSVKDLFGETGLNRLIADREVRTEAAYQRALDGQDTMEDRLAALAGCRAAEGYMAEWTETEDGWLLIENHCPICAAAAECQNFCRSELDIFRRVLGPSVTVERVDHVLAGARRCAYAVRPIKP